MHAHTHTHMNTYVIYLFTYSIYNNENRMEWLMAMKSGILLSVFFCHWQKGQELHHKYSVNNKTIKKWNRSHFQPLDEYLNWMVCLGSFFSFVAEYKSGLFSYTSIYIIRNENDFFDVSLVVAHLNGADIVPFMLLLLCYIHKPFLIVFHIVSTHFSTSSCSLQLCRLTYMHISFPSCFIFHFCFFNEMK